LIFAHANAVHSPRVKEPGLRPREIEQAAVRQARGEKLARNSVWEVRYFSESASGCGRH
jgi:hypothetical protein